MANIINLDSLVAGREDTTVFQVMNPNGGPENMANSRVYYKLKREITDPNASAIVDVIAEQPDNAETQIGWISLTIPASQLPISLVENGNITDSVYGFGYQLSAISDRVEIMTGTQAVERGVDDDPQWGP